MKTQESLTVPWPTCQRLSVLVLTLALAGSIAWAGKPPKPPPEPQPGYRMVTLGTGEARKINDAGWVAGGIAVLDGTWYAHRVFVLIPQDTDADGIPDTWYAGENGVNDLVTILGTLGGSRDEAFDINDLGQIVGFSKVSYPTPTTPWRAVLWQVNPETYEVEMTDLGLLLDHDYTVALSINNRGQVLGYAGAFFPDTHYFLINPTDTDGDGKPDTWYADENSDGFNDLMINLGIVVSTSLIDINESGLIAGTSGDNGFLLRPKDVDGDGLLDWFTDVNPTDGINDLMILLPPPSGASGSWAWAVNENGLIVGSSEADAVLWQVNDDNEVIAEFNLGHIKGYERVLPRDLNDTGQVVGEAFSYPGGKQKFEACLSENGVMIKLADRVVDWGTWQASQSWASGINGRGEIVGGSWNVGGFIAIPVP